MRGKERIREQSSVESHEVDEESPQMCRGIRARIDELKRVESCEAEQREAMRLEVRSERGQLRKRLRAESKY